MLNRVFSILMTILLMVVTTLALMIVVIPKVLGGAPLTVFTGSMVPTFYPGDLIIVKPLTEADKEHLKVGDIISFMPNPGDPTMVTHRIIEKRSSSKGTTYITLGDANGKQDEPMGFEQIRAKYLYRIPWMGHVTFSGGVKTNTFYMIAGGFVLAGIVTMFVPTERKKKNKKSKDKLNEKGASPNEVSEPLPSENLFKNPFVDD